MKSYSLAGKVIGFGKATDEVKQHGILYFPTHKRTRKDGLLITVQTNMWCDREDYTNNEFGSYKSYFSVTQAHEN